MMNALSIVRMSRRADIFRIKPVRVDRASDLEHGRRMARPCRAILLLPATKAPTVLERTYNPPIQLQLSRNRRLIPPPCRTPKENHGASCGHVRMEYRTNQSLRYGTFTSEYPPGNKSKKDGFCTRKLGKMESRAFRPNEKKLQRLQQLVARTATPNPHHPFSPGINCTKSATMPPTT